MAILMRGGVYDDFDPNKLLPREFAVVLSNDTSTRDGKAIYICFGPGKVKRISTFEDMRDDMESAGAEVFEQYDAAFREILAQVQELAAQTEQYKDAVNSIRNDIVNTYMPQIQAAAAHAAAAKNSADSAADSAKLSESWAVGGTGTRVGEDTDNSKHYSKQAADLVEEAKQIIAASSSGALIPIDTRRFEDLPITSTTGYMYNISNDFVTDDRFVDGAGRFYGAGNNVYWTADGMWDVLAGIQAAEDFVGTQEEMNAKLEAGELRDGITAYVDGIFNYQPDVNPENVGLLPGGTIAFEEIPESPKTGYVYSLSNDFVTDERFEIGAGVHYSSGTSIYWNKDGKLSLLSGIKPASFSGTRAELDGSMNSLPVGTVAFLTGEEGVTIGRIEVVDGVKQFVGYPLSGGGGSVEVSGTQVGNVQDLVLKGRPDSLVLTWKDPENVIFNGEPIAEWAGTKVIRKEGEPPQSIEDGVLITDSTVKDQYSADGLQDTNVVDDVVYNYALFPYTTQNAYTSSDVNRVNGQTQHGTVYGFVIDQSKSDPAEMITYIETNANYTPAKMDFTAGKFDYGDWQDAFFMKFRPCFLNYDGTVEFYLDPDDYLKKEDGTTYTPSLNDNGNVMIEFPKVYWKIKPISEDVAEVYISDVKQDDEYVCWSHMDVDGNEIPYCYFSAYETYGSEGKARSISGYKRTARATYETLYNEAKANNLSEMNIWNITSFSDYTLWVLLVLLISKSTNSQASFGYGKCTGYVSATSLGTIATGTLNKNGVFYGQRTNYVKIFGIENLYGNFGSLLSGIVYNVAKGVSVKMHDDGVDDLFNGSGIGGESYELIPDTVPAGNRSTCIKKMKLTKNGFFFNELSGKNTYTEHYTDSSDYVTGSGFTKTLAILSSTPVSRDSGGIFNIYYNGTRTNDYSSLVSSFIVCRPMAK